MLSEAYTPNGHSVSHLPNANGLVVDGNYIDGSWELAVFVEDLGQEVRVRVLGELTLGGLMHRIVEGVCLQQSWSDHGIWWSDRNMWLLHNRTTLDQYGIQSDAKLMFRRMHGNLRVVLPSLIPIVIRVNYSTRVCNVVAGICKQLGIRHPEELSLMFPVTHEHLKSNIPLPVLRHGVRRSSVSGPHSRADTATLNRKHQKLLGSSVDVDRLPSSPYETLRSGTGTIMRLRSEQSLDQDLQDGGHYADFIASRSAKVVFADDWLIRPSGLIQKARLNSCWLDSSRSLLEHGVEPPLITDANESPPTLYLCFKYYTFYDLSLKYDVIRIHQLFEQARWSLLSGVFDCTEDEMVVFAAYQLQAQLQSPTIQHDGSNGGGLTDPFSSNYYPTLGPSSTIGGGTRMGGSRPSPEVPRRQYMTLGPSMHGFGNTSSLMRSPGAVSPLSGTSVIDGNSQWGASECGATVDEVDELLAGLEQSCGVAEEPGSATRSLRPNTPLLLGKDGALNPGSRGFDIPDTSEIPSLQDSLRVLRDQSLLLRRYKIYWVVIRELFLYLFKSERETECPLFIYSLRDCSVTPDVNTSSHKYLIRLNLLLQSSRPVDVGRLTNGPAGSIGSPTRLATREELLLRFEAAEQYTRWLAACRLTSKGRTLASRVAYEREMNAIWETLRLQVPGAPAHGDFKDASIKCLGDLTDFCAERIIRKARSKQSLRQRIVEAHANLRDMPATEAKYKYIQAWQRLTGFGRSYFTVVYDRGSKNCKIPSSGGGLFSAPSDDLIAITPSGVEVVSPHTGDVLRVWTFSELKSWDVNWEAGKVSLDFRNERILFRPLCANCKTVAEFLGGYVFLNQRTPEGNQEFNERMFLRLTGAHD